VQYKHDASVQSYRDTDQNGATSQGSAKLNYNIFYITGVVPEIPMNESGNWSIASSVSWVLRCDARRDRKSGKRALMAHRSPPVWKAVCR